MNKDDDLNFLDTGNGSDDMDIVGDEDFEIPYLQMTRKDPYIKSNNGEAPTPSAQEPDMGPVVQSSCGLWNFPES